MYMINPREGEIFILKQKYYQWDKYFEIFHTLVLNVNTQLLTCTKTTTIQCVFIVQFGYDKL
jgi:hypothetical protein